MPSPLAISNIILSQSLEQDTISDATPKLSYYRDVLQPNPLPVLLRVRRVRVFLISTVLTVAVAGITFVLAQGVTLKTIHDAAMIDSQSRRDALIQNYNSYVGNVAALAIKPLQLLTATVLPVWLWCFLTETVMSGGSQRSTKAKVLVLGATSLLVWLLSNSFHGVNVQLQYAQQSSGESTQIASSGSDGLVLESNSTSAGPVNSILRSAVTMDYRPTRSACTKPSAKRLIAAVEYGFPSRDWMQTMKPTNSSPLLPLGDNAARSLATYAYPMMHSFFKSPSDQSTTNMSAILSQIYPATATTNGDLSGLADDVNATFHKFVEASTTSQVKWFDTANIAFSVSATNLSSGFGFESVSFDIPFRAEYMQRRLTLVNNDTTSTVSYDNHQQSDNNNSNSRNSSVSSSPTGDYFFDVNIKEECGELACIVSPRGESATGAAVENGAQVRALAICLDDKGNEDVRATLQLNPSEACTHNVSTTSFLVFSFAQRIEGDAFNHTTGGAIVRLKNAKKFYSLTVGRLSWASSDLSATLDASACSQDMSCHGVSLPLEANEIIVASTSALPLQDLLLASPSATTWALLVGTVAQESDIGGTFKSDLVLPDLFSSKSSTLIASPSQCERERGNFLASITKNQWFSAHSEQQAYTSALFWLFQNGVVKQRESDSSSPSTGSSTPSSTSSSAGFVARLVVQVPRNSCILTYSGCAVVFLLSVSVLLFGKRHESRIEKHYEPFHLAQTLVGASSPFVPSPMLINSDLLNINGELLSSSESLREFEIMALTLRHRQATSTRILVPRPPCLSASASTSALRSAYASV